jgi:dolichyl-phosphooligosaccharide-protein glycotransferase
MSRKFKIVNVLFWVLVAGCILTSWWLRAGLPAKDLIVGNEVKLADVDAYYHVMQADFIFKNWPHIQTHSDLLSFPEGLRVGSRPLNAWLIATTAKATGQTVDWAAAYFPAVMGILSLIPILFIGWILWDRWVGLIAVGILSVIPGEYYGRLSLGISDQHAVEVVLMAFFVLFYLLAFKKHWAWSFLAGGFLFLYIMNWVGAPLLILTVLIFIVVQSMINQFKAPENNRMLCLVTFIPLAIGFGAFMLFQPSEKIYVLFYGGSTLAPVLVMLVSKYTIKLKPYFYPFILAVVVSAVLFGIWLWQPGTMGSTYNELYGLIGAVGSTAGSLGRTISEVQPILSPYGKFTFSLVWAVFGITFFTGLLGMTIKGWHLNRKPENLYILVWAMFLLLCTFLQRRFAYYSAMSLALFSGYFCWFILDKIAWHKSTKKEVKKGKPVKSLNLAVICLGVIAIIIAFIIPNYYATSRDARFHPYAQSQAWVDALTYLRTDTPNTNDYGILSWWDYGYWIARDGQRPVLCHPGGGHTGEVAQFLTASSTEEANKEIEGLKVKYVVIDYQMAKMKFYAIPFLAGKGQLTEQQYNDCMLVRLYFSENGIAGYRLVFQSSTQYEGQSQVKIFEKYQPKG